MSRMSRMSFILDIGSVIPAAKIAPHQKSLIPTHLKVSRSLRLRREWTKHSRLVQGMRLIFCGMSSIPRNPFMKTIHTILMIEMSIWRKFGQRCIALGQAHFKEPNFRRGSQWLQTSLANEVAIGSANQNYKFWVSTMQT